MGKPDEIVLGITRMGLWAIGCAVFGALILLTAINFVLEWILTGVFPGYPTEFVAWVLVFSYHLQTKPRG